MKRIIAMLAAAVLLSSPAVAEPYVNPSLSGLPKESKQVHVSIHDDVKDGCWTNIGEVRTYAEDSIREAGWAVVDESAFLPFYMDISLLGWRHAGTCAVYARVELSAATYSPILSDFVNGRVASHGFLITGYSSANQQVLNAVGELTKAIRDLPQPSNAELPKAEIPAPAEHEL